MLKPSYAELMDVLNENADKNDEVTSRYTIVIAAAKRARQLIDGDNAMVTEKKGKPLSTAVEEIAENKIKVVPEGEGTKLAIYMKKNLRSEMEEAFGKEEEPLFDDTTIESVSENSEEAEAEDFSEDDDFESDEDFDAEEDFDSEEDIEDSEE